ncbi:SAM methyltransferase [Acrasis kona]|uniref:SAM methyltransferase n=1 Tax=Acrasis kona TaxID=1008807 RepID=A0AAW2YLM6_9EUKA
MVFIVAVLVIALSIAGFFVYSGLPEKVLHYTLNGLIKDGSLTMIMPSGAKNTYGNGKGAKTVVRIKDSNTVLKLVLNSSFEVGQAFMDGRIILEEGDVYDFLEVLLGNARLMTGVGALGRIMFTATWVLRRLAQYNPVKWSKQNVAHHYDLSDELFDLFLDPDRQYSCSYFPTPDTKLEDSQALKKRHIAAKLLLDQNKENILKVLDIGSGWGGLAFYINKVSGANVTGITLSEEQHKVSNQRATDQNVKDKVHFEILDYRHETRKYDRVVSVGMLEHVGVNHFDEYFQKVAQVLTDDGVALIHSIGRSDGPGTTNPWIRKYIFPGGYTPALSEVLPAIERAGLVVNDIEILRLHYAETLRSWRNRFEAKRAEVRALYDERFCRMWEFYLASSEATFRYGGHMVFQVQLTKRNDIVPQTRDYIYETEQKLPLSPAPYKYPSK